MNDHEIKDVYYQMYKSTKFSTEELKQFPICASMTNEELERISDTLFEIGLIAQKIIIESNE